MAKLTRTQKFAELRESLVNDKEPSLSTNELKEYEDRMNSITGQTQTAKQPEIKAETKKPFEEDSKYIWKAFEETPVDQLLNSLDEYDQTDNEQSANEAVSDYVIDNPFAAAKPVQTPAPEVNQQVVNEAFEQASQPVQPAYQAPVQPQQLPNDYVLDADEVNEPVQPASGNENVGQYVQDAQIEAAYAEAQHKAQEEADRLEAERKALEEKRAAEAQAIREKVEVPADNHVPEHTAEVHNTYLNETMNEVGEYNRRAGEANIDELTSGMVDEIRGHAQVQQPVVAERPQPVENNKTDEEFSSTVSMEIDKIMGDLESEEPEVEEIPLSPAAKKEEPVKEEPVKEEHPVAAQVMTEEGPKEEVVEIKNIDEMEETATRETLSNTIPFVVAAEDEEVIDDDVEEDSNTILNVILIVLIVILLAVLGLIVFYILKTKGII